MNGLLLSLATLAPASLAGETPLEPTILPIVGKVRQMNMGLDPESGLLFRTARPEGLNDRIYNNTCPSGSFISVPTAAQSGGSFAPAWGDWGGLPDSSFAGLPGECMPVVSSDSHPITSFTISYCTSSGVPVDAVMHFWDRTATGGAGLSSCDSTALIGAAVPPAVPTELTITLTGLPRSSAASPVAQCYTVNISIGEPGFSLSGGSGFVPGSTTGPRFAWSFQMLNGTGTQGGGNGPVLAGDPGSCSHCTGTPWEDPMETDTPGTGLGQDDHLWYEAFGGSPATGNCQQIPGEWAGLYLELFCLDVGGGACLGSCPYPIPRFCDGSDGSLASCPCGNPGGVDAGCDNAQATGGVRIELVSQTTTPNAATLRGTGFSTMGSPTAIVIRSNAIDPATPVVFGDGLRCVSTTGLVRIGATIASAGESTHTFGHNAMAGPGYFYYQVWYRNQPLSFCDPLAEYNLSGGMGLLW